MCAEAFKVDIDDAQVKALLRQAPDVFNREFNRGFSRTMGAFYRKFTSERLKKGGIQVRRKGKTGGGGGVFVPKKARFFGFTGKLEGKQRLGGKVVIGANRSPVAKAHEFGATIKPKKGQFLFVRIGSAAAARRAGIKIKRGQKPTVIRVRRVVIKPRLGFLKTFRAFTNEATRRLGESLNRAAQAAIRKAQKAKSRRPR